MLLTAVRNILQLDNNVNGTHCWVFTATLSSFIRLCIVYSDIAQQYTHNSWLRFYGNNGYATAPYCYIIHCLFCSLFHSFLLAFLRPTFFIPYFFLRLLSFLFPSSFQYAPCKFKLTIAGQTAWTEHSVV